MTMNLLAEVTAGGISPETVGVIIASVIIALISGGVLGKKVSDSSRTTIDPQPLMVRMQEDFVTRREFDKLETVVAVNAAKSEGYLRQASEQMEKAVVSLSKSMERSNERLVEQINSVSRGAYEGRQRLHTKVNDQGEQIAKLQAQVAVGTELAEVGEKIATALKSNSKPIR